MLLGELREAGLDLQALPLSMWLAVCDRFEFSPEPNGLPAPRTYAEIAAWLGMSTAHVKAAENGVLDLLRRVIRPYEPGSENLPVSPGSDKQQSASKIGIGS